MARASHGLSGARSAGLGLLLALTPALPAMPAGAEVTWEDVADEVGVVFRLAGEVHPPQPNPDGWPGAIETVGSAACWLDFDNDGFQDLYLVNQVYNAANPAVDEAWARAADPHHQLFRNLGDGSFGDVSAAAGVDSRAFGYGCSVADFDGDGFEDLFLANYGDNGLYRNLGDGAFANVSASSGLELPGACGEYPCMNTGSAWADFDRDGDLDLFVAKYGNAFPEDTTDSPSFYEAQADWLFRNEGDGTFTEVTEQAGVAGEPGITDGSRGLGVVWLDADLDTWMDLYVCNDMATNELYINLRDGTFEDRSMAAGVDDDRASMGCASADYDGDGLPDLYMTHYADEHNGFYRNNGDGTFEDRSAEDELTNDLLYVGWGTAFVDIDRDADLDIVAVNGWPEADFEEPAQSKLVFRNDPPQEGARPWDRRWVDVSASSGAGITGKRVSRGAAFADYDLDGDPDIAVVNNANDTAELLRASGEPGHWLYVQLRQPGMNPRAVGATVELLAAGVTQTREVQTGSNYLGQNSLDLEFGLGGATQAERLTVHWPDGGKTTLGALPADRVVRVDRASGSFVTDTLSPRTHLVVEGTPGTPGWWLSTADVSLAAEDLAVGPVSGIAASEVAVDGGPWQAYGDPLRLGGGLHQVRMRSRDAAGNQEQARVEQLGVDLRPPVAYLSLSGTPGLAWWWRSVTVGLSAQDDLSGVDEIRYRFDDGPWETYVTSFAVPDGVHLLSYQAVDNAGHTSTSKSAQLRVDGTPPLVRLEDPQPGMVYVGDARLGSVPSDRAVIVTTPDGEDGLGGPLFEVRADPFDATSGVARVVFRVDGSLVAVKDAAPWTWTWDTREWPLGSFTVEAAAYDVAGNRAAADVDVLLASATRESLAETLARGPHLPNLGPTGPLVPGKLT